MRGMKSLRNCLISCFGIGAVDLVGDLLGEVVALAEHLAGDVDDFLGVVVVLGEDQRLRHLVRPGNSSVNSVSR